jgi:tRNA pseudouridine55 synthase
VINLDKPRGITSHEAVTRVRKLLGIKKAGHAGALDPLATGVLLVCAGEATKISRFLMDLGKEYVATMKFGERTDTLDADGKVIETDEGFSFGPGEVEAVLSRFRGAIRQRPPMYSALKVGGKPLYKLARKGEEVERAEREVRIYGLAAEDFSPPLLRLRVSCSRGTYIRVLVDDIGRALGTVAHMTELRRVRIGGFGVEGSAGLEELPGRESAAVSVDSALSHLREAVLSAGDYSHALNGRPFGARAYGVGQGESLRLKDPGGRLFAIGVVSGERIKIDRILHLNQAKP